MSFRRNWERDNEMEEQKYTELERRSSRLLEAELTDHVRKLEAQHVIHAEIERMRDEGKALTLTDEEFSMLEAFRRFKLRMRRDGEIFTWQSRRPVGVQIVQETAEIIDPRES